MIKNKSQILKYVNIVLTIGVFVFAYLYGKSLFEKAGQSDYTINYFYLFCSGLLFFLFYLIFAYHWLRVCRLFDANVDKKQIAVFFASQPYKYLPTSLFTFSFRAKFAKDVGLNIKKSSLAQLIENFDIVAGAFIVATLFFAGYILPIIVPLFLILGILVYKVLPQNLSIKIKNKSKEFNKKEATTNISIISLGWIVCGLAFYFISLALDADIGFFIAVVANTVAYIMGLLVIFAPGGVGVRELIFSFFAISSPVIIFWRILTFVCDVFFGSAAILYLSHIKKLQHSLRGTPKKGSL